MTEETHAKADAIKAGLASDYHDQARELQAACLALAMLTSARKDVREAGKELVRTWTRRAKK